MAGSISHFLSEFERRGASRASHFDVLIPIPQYMVRSKLPAQVLTFRCEAAEIPGRQLNSSDVKIYGPIYKTPFQSLYAETTLTFIETGDMDVRFFFEEWMNLIINSETNRITYPDEYISNMEVRQYDVVSDRPDPKGSGGIAGGPDIVKDDAGRVSRVYREINLRKTLTTKFVSAFPTNINQMPTAWSDDSFHRLQVTFFYRYYTLVQHSLVKDDPIIKSSTPPPSSPDLYAGTDDVG